MKNAMKQWLVAGLVVTCGFMLGCGKSETNSADALEKKVKATKSAAVDAAACPVKAEKAPATPETAIPKDHPAH